MRSFGKILFDRKEKCINLLVIILNPWWWVIIQREVWSGLLVFILSFLLLQLLIHGKSGIILISLISLTMILVFITVKQAFDESVFRESALDIQQYNKRHEFYANGLGKIYTNRLSLTYFKEYNFPLYKLNSNFFANLDPNLYFFKSHPRERLGIGEFEKYFPIFLPFFLLGFLYSIYKPLPKIMIYLVAISLISSIISPKYNLGPVLFFPVINFMITVGIILSLTKITKILKR